jgi:2,3-bisphosphoglycerate-dependent phosphoglycerate mutase
VELVLVRHALPERVEASGRPADPPLSELGRRQAQALARWLAPEPVHALYVSPLRRALETAGPVAEITGLDPVVAEGVAEYDRDAEAYIPLEELKASNDPRWQEMVEGRYFEAGELDARAFQDTVVAAIDAIVAENRSRTAVVVCHGGVMNAYVGHVLGLDDYMIFEPAYTGLTRIRASSRGHRMIVTLNESPHLRDVRPAEGPAG